MKNSFDLSFELSEESISNLRKNINKVQQELEKSKEYILLALADYTYEQVMKYVPKGHTGQLVESIKKSSILNDMIRVYTDLAYARYVEFGTGITGKSNPHPESSEWGWKYDVNEHGEKGWTYKASDGKFYWTDGQEGQEFMYKAWLDVKEHYLEIARKVLIERGLIKG